MPLPYSFRCNLRLLLESHLQHVAIFAYILMKLDSYFPLVAYLKSHTLNYWA